MWSAERYIRECVEMESKPSLSLHRAVDKLIFDRRSTELLNRASHLCSALWLPSQIPLATDHGIQHHTNLFAIAARLLTPILSAAPSFLSSSELLCLLGSIYFHDCGLAVSEWVDGEGRVRLPLQVIRAEHPLLAYARLQAGLLQSGLYDSDIIYDLLMGEDGPGATWGSSRSEVWYRYLQAMATVSVYHVLRYPLYSRGEEAESFVDVQVLRASQSHTVNALAERGPLFCHTEWIAPRRLVLLACLLRMIDCLDTGLARLDRDGGRERRCWIEAEWHNASRRCDQMSTTIREYEPLLTSMGISLDWPAHNYHDPAIWKKLDILPENIRSGIVRYNLELLRKDYLKSQIEFINDNARIRSIQIRASFEGGGDFLVDVECRPQNSCPEFEVAFANLQRNYRDSQTREVLYSAGVTFSFTGG